MVFATAICGCSFNYKGCTGDDDEGQDETEEKVCYS
jgi:hypothetical protein